MQFLSFGVPVGSVCRAIAAVLENVLFQPAHKGFLQRKLALPSRRFVQDMVIELGSLNKCVLDVLCISAMYRTCPCLRRFVRARISVVLVY